MVEYPSCSVSFEMMQDALAYYPDLDICDDIACELFTDLPSEIMDDALTLDFGIDVSRFCMNIYVIPGEIDQVDEEWSTVIRTKFEEFAAE